MITAVATEPASTTRQLWWLTVYDPYTGIATRVVGVLGVDDLERHLSWMPLDDDTIHWAEALATSDAFADITTVVVDAAATIADGVVLGFVPIEDPPHSCDLVGAVEAAIDLALIASIERKRAS